MAEEIKEKVKKTKKSRFYNPSRLHKSLLLYFDNLSIASFSLHRDNPGYIVFVCIKLVSQSSGISPQFSGGSVASEVSTL